MQTGKPFVEKEKDGFDVSLPLHDSTGKLIGVVGIGFKAAAGQTEASVTEQGSQNRQRDGSADSVEGETLRALRRRVTLHFRAGHASSRRMFRRYRSGRAMRISREVRAQFDGNQ